MIQILLWHVVRLQHRGAVKNVISLKSHGKDGGGGGFTPR
jgi:hypothetical protein